MEESTETIVTRFMRLNKLILGKSNYSLPRKYLVHRDALLDVLFALYEECNVDFLRKNKNINAFVDKFKVVMPELKALRVNLKDFEVKKVIGRGHFGTVNVVKEKATGDVYAMKVLCKQETLSQENVAFYEEERDIMVKTSSPWLTKLQYAFQDNKNLYLVMEFHPGGDMVSLLQKNDYVLPDDMCKFYLAELVLAINSLHTMGYVHRDIKPDNILIDRTGHIKLADFGSAAKLNINNQVTSSMPVGTPDYIAPEVLTAMNAIPASSISYGGECDWWSLGIVAYEMTFGSTPFASDKVLFTYSNIMNFKTFFQLPPEADEVPSSLANLITNLIKESGERLNYNQLVSHELFLDIDWNNIRNTPPPFLPTVSSEDDSSNFDEFEADNRPVFSEIKSKLEFNAKNLPFVGFTYCPPFENSVEKLPSDSIISQSADFSDLDTTENRVLLELEKEVRRHVDYQKSLCAEIQKLKETVEAKEQEIQAVKEQKTLSDEFAIEAKGEVHHLKDLLRCEHDHRMLTEQKANRLVICMKQKQKQDAILLKVKSNQYQKGNEAQTLEELLTDANHKIEELTKQNTDLTQSLYDTKHILLDCQWKLSEKEKETSELELNLSGCNSSLNESLRKSSPIVEKKLVKKLERKNIQLEKELDIATNLKAEAEAKVVSLQKIIDEFENKLEKSLDSVIEVSNVSETDKIKKISKEKSERDLESIIEDLQEKLSNEQKIKNDLQDKLEEMEAELQAQENNLKDVTEKMEELLEENPVLHKRGSDFAVKKAVIHEVKIENELAQESSPNFVKKTNERQERLLISDMKHENNCMKTKIEMQTSELSELKADLKKKENAYAELEKQLLEKNNSLSDLKLELRVSNRKERLNETLREMNRDLRDQLKAKEETILEKMKLEDENKAQIKVLENEVNDLKLEIQGKEKLFEIEKVKYQERVKTLKDTCDDTKDVTQKFVKTQGQYEEISKQNMSLAKECEEKTKQIVKLAEEVKNLKNEISKKQSECIKHEKIISTLKNACMDMENDLNDFETLVEARDTRISKILKERDDIQCELKKSKEDIKILRSSLEKHEEQKDSMLKHVKELTSELESQASVHETEIQILQDEINHYKKSVEQLEKASSDLENDLSSHNKDTANYCKKIIDLESQLCLIKEEAAAHITQISSLKSSNLKLTESLEDALKKQGEMKKSIDELYNDKESEKAKYDQEKVKLQETISQQTKLIDFLQTKTENMEKKKRPISRLFGKKENPQSTTQSRDLEKLLEAEKSKCRRLQDQLSQARAEKMILQRKISNLSEAMAEAPATPNSRAMHTAITYSPSSQSDSNSLHESNSSVEKIIKPLGMKHKIPHRFNEIMCMRNAKCCICLDSMYLGRSVVKCEECLLECHPKCASSLPKTCGLPSGFMQHFKTAVENSKSCDKNQSADSISEGWIKIPKSNKHGWDKKYMRFNDDVLYIFENSEEKDSEEALMEFDFTSNKAAIFVNSAVSATELSFAAASDLPFVLKVESRTTCWPERCLYIMTSNFSEKQMWVSLLEKAAEANQAKADSSRKKLEGQTIWTTKGSHAIDPLCTSNLNENIILLGATEGLCVFSKTADGTLSMTKKIEDITCIYQIIRRKNLGVIFFINGENRNLSFTACDSVISYKSTSSSESLLIKPVANIENCHLFAVEEGESESPFVCCATSQTIVLCQYNSTTQTFYNKKILAVNEPCSCLLFSENSLIFGTDVFYQLELTNFSIKRFLDGSDASLAGLVYGAPQCRSFPVAIVKISNSKQSGEYLLCFHEMGVFVNSEGRKTRTVDMKWSKLPLSFTYRHPYLFITHFNWVEVVEISSNKTSTIGNRAAMGVQNARYMGWAISPMSILISSKNNQTVSLLQVDCSQIGCSEFEISSSNGTSSESSSPKNNGIKSQAESLDLDFSFTSSIDQGVEPFDQTALSEDSTEN